MKKLFRKFKTFFTKMFRKNVVKYTLYVGLNDKDTKKQQISQEQAKRIISRVLANNRLTGATCLNAEGFYTYLNTNTLEQEKSFKIEILFASDEQIVNIVSQIKELLNQESVAVVREKIASSLL